MGESISEHYDESVRRNYRWNFAVNVGDLSFVNLARAFVFSTTILPLYVSYLTSSTILIGLIPAILEVGFLLPQIFMARRTETLERMKPFIVRVSVWERVPYLIIAATMLLLPQAPVWLSYTLLAINITVASGSGGLATPAWKTMLGKIIHPDRRGMLASLGIGIGGLMGIAGAYLTRFLLGRFPYPRSYAYCFALAFTGQALSWLFLTFNREPSRNLNPTHGSLREYLRGLPSFLRENRDFAFFLLSQIFVILGTLAITFYVLYGRERLGISDEFAATLTMVALASQSLGTPVIGWFSDRFGHKSAIVGTTILQIAALLIMLILPGRYWLALVFVLSTLSVSGMKVARFGITMEFGRIEKLPTFTAIAGTLLSIPTLLAPVLGGWFVDVFGYRPSFVIALVLSLIGMIMTLRGMRDPRKEKGRAKL